MNDALLVTRAGSLDEAVQCVRLAREILVHDPFDPVVRTNRDVLTTAMSRRRRVWTRIETASQPTASLASMQLSVARSRACQFVTAPRGTHEFASRFAEYDPTQRRSGVARRRCTHLASAEQEELVQLGHRSTCASVPSTHRIPSPHVRLPGLFRFHEVEDVLRRGSEFVLVRATAANDGPPLFAVYCRASHRASRRVCVIRPHEQAP